MNKNIYKLESIAFLILPIIYFVRTCTLDDKMYDMFSGGFHYSKIIVLWRCILAIDVVLLLVSLFLLIRLFFNKTKFKLLQFLVLIPFSCFLCFDFMAEDVTGQRLITRLILPEKDLIKYGDDLIRNVKSSKDKQIPTLDNWQSDAFDEEEDFFVFNLNKHVFGLRLEDIPHQTVLLVEKGIPLLEGADEAAFKNSCNGEFLFLYMADSRIVVYVKQSDEYRYFESHEIVDVIWNPN